MKRCQREAVEISRGEYFTRHLHRDQLRALALIAKAANREGPCVGRGGQVRDEASLAPFMAAAQGHWCQGRFQTDRTIITAQVGNMA